MIVFRLDEIFDQKSPRINLQIKACFKNSCNGNAYF